MIIKKTLDHLLKGNVILYPTDTSWGIGGDSSSDLVVRKIFNIKTHFSTSSRSTNN